MSDEVKLHTADEASRYVFEQIKSEHPSVTSVSIREEKEIDGHKYWRWFGEGEPAVATRVESWIRDDGEKFGIFMCFEHNLEDIVAGKVPGPLHKVEDDRVSA